MISKTLSIHFQWSTMINVITRKIFLVRFLPFKYFNFNARSCYTRFSTLVGQPSWLELVRDRSRNSPIERQGRAIWKWRRACTRGHASRQRLAYICPRGRVRRTPVDPVCRFVQVSQRLLRVVLNFNRAEEAKERRNRPADAARTRTHHGIQNHGLANPLLEKLSVRFFSLSPDIQKMLFEFSFI